MFRRIRDKGMLRLILSDFQADWPFHKWQGHAPTEDMFIALGARSSVVEHPTFNRMVESSNLSGRTILFQ